MIFISDKDVLLINHNGEIQEIIPLFSKNKSNGKKGGSSDFIRSPQSSEVT